MYAPALTASTPIRIDVAPVQLEIGSPASPAAGTWPEAIAPIAQPKKNGVSSEARAKVPPSSRSSATVAASPRIAKAAPRKMIPTAARKRGT